MRPASYRRRHRAAARVRSSGVSFGGSSGGIRSRTVAYLATGCDCCAIASRRPAPPPLRGALPANFKRAGRAPPDPDRSRRMSFSAQPRRGTTPARWSFRHPRARKLLLMLLADSNLVLLLLTIQVRILSTLQALRPEGHARFTHLFLNSATASLSLPCFLYDTRDTGIPSSLGLYH